MADASHLEKMGRELKCPICLSLLDSAASLTCNHVFCNSCIHKYMKSGSDCPVCKAPYHRREIRPAPHMDNLVKIYKSMEVASGVNLFVTQNPATTKLTGSEKLDEGDDADVVEKESGLETPETVKHKRMERAWSKKISTSTPKNSGRRRGKPSFRTNKRVQVPQSPITETPARPEKKEIGKLKMVNEVINNSSSSPSGCPPSNRKGSPRLSPFFWLREEEDAEKSSQEIDVDHLTGTPAKTPCFSDIKDSDDDGPSRTSPKEGRLRRCSNADLFDSEMFEWTQRACSPELCSSPVKVHTMVGAIGEFYRSREKLEEHLRCADTNEEVIMEHVDNISSLEKNSVRHIELDGHSSPESESDYQNDRVMPCKRGRHACSRSHGKRRKNNVLPVRKSLGDRETDEFLQEQGCDSDLALGSSKYNCSPKFLNEVNDPVISKLPASSDSKKLISEDKKIKKFKKSLKSNRQSNRVGTVQGKKKKQNTVTPDKLDEVTVSQDRQHEDTTLKSYLSIRTSVEKACNNKRKSISCKDNCIKKRNCPQMRCEMKERISEDEFCRDKIERNEDVHHDAAQTEKNNDQGVPSCEDLEGSSTKRKVCPQSQRDVPILRKCDVNSTKCAFCYSTEETEASGEMVHYSAGRPVSENHSAGSVIHSHRNCTEWAPNVYFEDDVVVNLEEELARSRRIKCSLCGMRGAALGCYEKSCRKSFHVPCAKMLRECHWDNDNFVIICPLHASLKLPCELSISQPKKNKSKQKGKNLQRQPQVAAGSNTNRNSWSFCGSSTKIVLCCSGLSTTEKETVSEFTKASGAVVSTSWASAVTHVIASVDENGACKRTLKVLMGILEGKWILSIKWVQACMKAGRPVDEAPYEINSDIHGLKNGPCLGRLRLINKQPKLFAGFKFYLCGDFAHSYKGYIQDLIVAAGGTILHRKPVTESDSIDAHLPPTVIIYSAELPEKSDLRKKDSVVAFRRSDAEALVNSTGSKVANNLWLLNCIAGHKLQDL